MSLPQTECSAPPGSHASVNVCPSLPLSDVAFACQVVGVPPPDGGTGVEDGPVFELSGAVLAWPPSPFSFFSFEQPTLPSRVAVSKSTKQTRIICRSSRKSDPPNCRFLVD